MNTNTKINWNDARFAELAALSIESLHNSTGTSTESEDIRAFAGICKDLVDRVCLASNTTTEAGLTLLSTCINVYLPTPVIGSNIKQWKEWEKAVFNKMCSLVNMSKGFNSQALNPDDFEQLSQSSLPDRPKGSTRSHLSFATYRNESQSYSLTGNYGREMNSETRTGFENILDRLGKK